MRSRFLPLILGMAGAAAALSGQNEPLAVEDLPVAREGPYWVRTTQEITVKPPQPRLTVVLTRGKITLRGGSGDQVTWKLKQRLSKMAARTEGIARARLGDISVEATRFGNLTHLVITLTRSPSVSNELELMVPRNMELVSLQTGSGGIAARDLDGDILARAGSGQIELAGIGGNVLEARTGGGNIRLTGIGGSVKNCGTQAGAVILDSGGEASCVTAGGDMFVQNAGGPLDVSTGGGNINVAKAASSVTAFSMAGLIDIVQAGGLVMADARGGSIRVGSARGIQAASVAGMVNVRGASGPISVSTAMGSILAELLGGARLEDSSLVAGSGDITVLVPSNFPLSVMATSRIVSDFPEVRMNSTSFFRAPFIAQGAINGGGPMLRLNAGGGVIYLKRAK